MSRRLHQSQDLAWSSRRAVEIGREEPHWVYFFFPFLESKQSILSQRLGPVTAEWLKVAGRSFSSTNTHRRWRPKKTSHTCRSRNTLVHPVVQAAPPDFLLNLMCLFCFHINTHRLEMCIWCSVTRACYSNEAAVLCRFRAKKPFFPALMASHNSDQASGRDQEHQ